MNAGCKRSLTVAAAGLPVAAALGALAVLAVPGLGLALYPHAPNGGLADDAQAALALVAHNAAVALWPLCLVALDWHRIPRVCRLGDGLVAAQLAVNGASVGAAFATWPELIRWLAHLPAEWSALAIPCAAWISARRQPPPTQRQLVAAAVATLALLLLAAALETRTSPA
jgi:hypothetical protein